jgi:hypothetical protein
MTAALRTPAALSHAAKTPPLFPPLVSSPVHPPLQETASEAVSFVANDINKIFEGCQEIHYLWWVTAGCELPTRCDPLLSLLLLVAAGPVSTISNPRLIIRLLSSSHHPPHPPGVPPSRPPPSSRCWPPWSASIACPASASSCWWVLKTRPGSRSCSKKLLDCSSLTPPPANNHRPSTADRRSPNRQPPPKTKHKQVVPSQYYFGWKIIKNKLKNFKNTNERYGIIQVG